MADHLDAELVATEIRNSRWFDSYRKTEAARHLFQDKFATISDMAADHGVEIRDVRQKAVGDRPKDILRMAHEINPNILVSGARGGIMAGQGLSDRAAGLFNLSKYNLLLVKDMDHDMGEYKKILVSADSPINIADCATNIASGYDAELTAVQVVDLEEGLVRERVVYLPEAAASSGAGRQRRRLGEVVKTPLTRRERFDLLVMGSKNESVLKRLMHKTAPEAIARKVHSSVFAVIPSFLSCQRCILQAGHRALLH
jgi:nucleotide-binding universal stress UspA family protein